MDRLVAVDPVEITIDFKRGQKAQNTFRVRNLMHTMSVAFKISTTEPKKYAVRPGLAIISPLCEILVEVTTAAQAELPSSIPVSEDKFVVKSLMLPTGKATDSELNELFSKNNHIFTDATLKVVYTGNLILRSLVESGSSNDVKEVLLRCKDVNSKYEHDLTPLHIAAIRGNSEIVQDLLDSGAIVDAKNSTQKSPLLEAAFHGHVETVKTLLSSGANTEIADARGHTALHVAASGNYVQILNFILFSGANINAQDIEGKTPLYLSVIDRHLESVQLLVGAGANVDAKDKDGWTVIHCAAACGYLDIIKVLLVSGNKYARTNDGKTALGLALDKGHKHLLDALHLGDMLQKTSREGDVITLKSCLAQGAMVNGKDQHGWSALHRAAFKGHLDTVKFLHQEGAEINSLDDNGFTPLHCASETGRKDVVEYLIKHGADVNATSIKGETPLQLASSMGYSGYSPKKVTDPRDATLKLWKHRTNLTPTKPISRVKGSNNLGQIIRKLILHNAKFLLEFRHWRRITKRSLLYSRS
ncbi:protein VAPYRIN isoform X1 [Cryptomeria japonica]|uniref:protein VAPYRIN isoform X1 n=1 Tax=Cryptomeria japonica TaxID=3369 RepID=UPI0027DA78CB|nr:protein VAPYRIN isoform X1 [Cryptomeria japonica]XP_059066954.1 protein VAPYRIN isoform X1 [Cryptomeria japonica]